MLSRCTPPGSGGTPQPPTPAGGDALEQLRSCWQRFDWLIEKTQDWDHSNEADEARQELVDEHRAGLDELVAIGELDAAVADHIQSAYAAAVYHVWRSYAPITCYEPVLIDYKPASSGQLVRQSHLLAEMAESNDLDPAVVAQAQAAIERDIAFLSLSGVEIGALYEELRQAAGDSYDFPQFDELELEITPEAAEAARFLIELLLEE
jgi:hypothetical protein